MTTEEKIKQHRGAIKILQDIEKIERREYLASGIDEGYCQQKRADLEEEYNEFLDNLTEKIY